MWRCFLESIGTTDEIDLILLNERRLLAKRVGKLKEICGVEIAVLPIKYIRPRSAHRMITVYVASSLTQAYEVLAPRSPWLGWLSLDTEGVFVDGKAKEGLRKLQTLFVDSCVSGMLHQLPLNSRKL